MAAFAEPEDDYAADGEGAAVGRQRSMKKREFGLYASRLRQRPPTKRDAASDVAPVPAATPRSVYDDLPCPISPPPRRRPPLTSPISPVSPASPLSPRWASLATTTAVPQHPDTAPPTLAASSSDPPTPRRSTSSSSSSPFPGLSSHPYVPPAVEAGSPTRPDTDNAGAAAVNPSSSPSASSRREPRASAAMENFSRPRKPSVRQHPYDVTPTRTRQPDLPSADQSPLQSQSAWPRDRARGLSLTSVKSSSTHASVSKRPSHDHTFRHALPPRTSGGMASPGLPRPPVAYSRADATPVLPSLTRDPLPWIADDELRSSYRSQLTASTTQVALFTPTGTERSSVLTKASSRTSVSLLAATGLTADEGLSVEDVMGMYEKGFYSTGAEDNDTDLCYEDHPSQADPQGSRPGTSQSDGSGIGIDTKLAEAMSDSLPRPLPLPVKDVPVVGYEPYVLRDSGAFFRNSGLPSPASTQTGFGLQEAAEGRTERPMGGLSRPRRGLAQTEGGLGLEFEAPTRLSPLERSTTLDLVLDEGAGTAPAPGSKAGDDAFSATGPFTAPSTVPQQQDASARDRYGFRKHNQHITSVQYDEWNGPYTDYIARRRKKWVAYLKDSGLATDQPKRFPPPGPKTKRYIRKGIPPEWRGAAWFHYAQGPNILAKHPGLYDDLAERAARGETKDIDSEAIERDLHRTFPDNVRFKMDDPQSAREGADAAEPEIISSLRRVLLAFSIHHPRIGYCQSLNFLAGLLLLFVETEEQCFWLLDVITQVHLPGTHETSLEGSKVDLGLLMAELQDSMPTIWAKVGAELDDGAVGARLPQPLAKHGTLGRKSKRPKPVTSRSADALNASERLPPITLCMTAWFMSCFIGTLPIETTLRVWDVFFYEGSKTLFRVALGIFKLGEAEIRAVADPMEMFGVVQAIPRRLLDCNLVMEATFRRRNGFGHLSQESIEERRRQRRDAIRGAAKEASAVGDAPVVTSPSASGLADLVGDAANPIRRKGTLFGRRKERRPAEV